MIESQNGKPDYSLVGFSDAAKVKGSIVAYSICLEKFFTSILLEHNLRYNDLENRKKEIEEEVKKLKEKISIKNKELEDLQNKQIPDAQNDLKKNNDEYLDFKQNPSRYINIQKDKFSLWLYGTLSTFIGLFLFFFYSSVIYSAFFREIKLDKMTWFNSIFYPKAIEEAWTIGLTAGMLVILAPIIFLALGIVIDRLKHKSKSRIKFGYIAGLIFTFLLDALFAYHISERIYEAKAINVYDNVKPFNLALAIQNLDFWMIIAMGFCVYILFGIVFSNFDEQRSFKNEFEKVENTLRDKINIAEQKLAELLNREAQIKSEILKIEENITEIRKTTEVIVFSPLELKNILSDYTIGWISFLANAGNSENDIKQLQDQLNFFYQIKGIVKNENK
ncbi:MAG: hypothetical protein ACPL25_05955 [Ignavibacteria bacterium]